MVYLKGQCLNSFAGVGYTGRWECSIVYNPGQRIIDGSFVATSS